MQEQDNIEEYYRKVFTEFEPPPPAHAWAKISSRLHPPEGNSSGIMSLKKILANAMLSRNLYPLLATAAMLVLIFFIWFSYSNKHIIRGHAYAGETRLCMGTAFLFKVYDKVKPYDTVKLLQTVKVDANGFYQFIGLDQGNYMIRISPQPGSEMTRTYLPSFYNQDSASADANLIRMGNEDSSIDIHLLPR